ncbi:CCR4-Not complex CAF1 ribonuclease subunit caf1 [Trebouxia sp. C0010 RCD-2024]
MVVQEGRAPEGLTCRTPSGETLRVREVWQENLEEEFDLIRDIVDEYPFVAMDTEFPGVVARPVGNFKNSGEYHFQTLREFKLSDDMFAQDSIELLKQSGIDFAKMEARGIDVSNFGELLMSSGIVLNEDVKWITFHSGYDFGYLLKVLTCQPLPKTEADFFELLKLYFPTVYDIKYLMKFCDNLHGGLNKLAEVLQVERIGPQHQAGSDSLLTSSAFVKLASSRFKGFEQLQGHKGVLFGLGVDGNNEMVLTDH